MKHALKHIHFTGIGGAGMSGIAEMLLAQGYAVTGSDVAESDITRRLQALGIAVRIGHAAAQIEGADALVVSSALKADNPEVLAARQRGVPVVHRAVMLAELMRRQQGVAIAGTHGKTTTTSLVTTVLIEAGLDPSFVIGGTLASANANSRQGRGDFIVVEADESDASFLHLLPVLAVITNIDADHMDTYGHSLQRLHQAFVDFVHRMPFYGAAVACVDDAGVRAVLPRLQRPVVGYGLSDGAAVRALDVQALPGGRMRFTARRAGLADLPIELGLAGEHNVRNALAAIAVAAELEVPDAAVQRALANFAGVGRRFQRWGEFVTADGGACTLIDDYGHHPVEMAAVLAAARGAFPGRRLVLAFQPHRYTRTRDCFADFVRVLGQADAVWLTEVYAAGEAPIAGADGASLAAALQAAGTPVQFVERVADLAPALAAQLRGGDVLIGMGAGSIAQLAPALKSIAGQARVTAQ
ncbi:MAG: UDP-N-acetylmuramate--L-alanine ligase [Proteobacteria bacterium]|nr:UDP-N-acetylmuramate--L-alanine ligase [Pseudomonadota bacterium]